MPMGSRALDSPSDLRPSVSGKRLNTIAQWNAARVLVRKDGTREKKGKQRRTGTNSLCAVAGEEDGLELLWSGGGRMGGEHLACLARKGWEGTRLRRGGGCRAKRNGLNWKAKKRYKTRIWVHVVFDRFGQGSSASSTSIHLRPTHSSRLRYCSLYSTPPIYTHTHCHARSNSLLLL